VAQFLRAKGLILTTVLHLKMHAKGSVFEALSLTALLRTRTTMRRQARPQHADAVVLLRLAWSQWQGSGGVTGDSPAPCSWQARFSARIVQWAKSAHEVGVVTGMATSPALPAGRREGWRRLAGS